MPQTWCGLEHKIGVIILELWDISITVKEVIQTLCPYLMVNSSVSVVPSKGSILRYQSSFRPVCMSGFREATLRDWFAPLNILWVCLPCSLDYSHGHRFCLNWFCQESVVFQILKKRALYFATKNLSGTNLTPPYSKYEPLLLCRWVG